MAPKENKPTKNQHYIPQVYLRGFSPEYEKEKRKEIKPSACTIYFYDLAEEKQSKAVPIDTVCLKKYLYEVRNEDGELILPNYVENVYRQFEGMFGQYRTELEKKAFLPENLKTKCFLKHDEKAFWMTYILLQCLRLPKMLKEVERVTLELFGNQINETQAKNFSREICSPFFKELNMDSIEGQLFSRLFEPMADMSFCVGVDRAGRLITSDKAVCVYAKEYPFKEYERIVFPITSQLCLFLIGGDEKKEYDSKNFLRIIDDDIYEMIFYSMVSDTEQKIYSDHILNKAELQLVKKARYDG